MRNGRGYLLLAGLGVAAVNCGGGTSENGGGGGTGFTAEVDGQPWEAEPISIAAQAVGGIPGALLVLGSQTSGGTTTSLTITLYNVTGPGTYALGVSSTVYGGIGQVGEGTGAGNGQSWITDNIGTAGTVVITTLSGGRIAGTFQYTTVAGHSNTVGGTRTVTNGQFDLAFTGTLTPVPDNVGSKVTALFNGDEYNAWSVSGLLQDHLGGPGFQFSTSTKEHAVSILLSGVTAPGTFTLSNTGDARIISAGHNGGDADHCCWGGGATGDDVGTVTITSITAARVKGTFSATLQPTPGKPATTPLVITDGTFDVGIN
jgi:hypothetical protein